MGLTMHKAGLAVVKCISNSWWWVYCVCMVNIGNRISTLENEFQFLELLQFYSLSAMLDAPLSLKYTFFHKIS